MIYALCELTVSMLNVQRCLVQSFHQLCKKPSCCIFMGHGLHLNVIHGKVFCKLPEQYLSVNWYI